MGILDNFENAWDIFPSSKNQGMDSENLMAKPDTCCNGCACTSSTDHNQESQGIPK